VSALTAAFIVRWYQHWMIDGDDFGENSGKFEQQEKSMYSIPSL
jgi:hypothetical protein